MDAELTGLLGRVGMKCYQQLLEAEAIRSADMLRSLGREFLPESLVDVGLEPEDAEQLSAVLFGEAPPACEPEEDVSLESNDSVQPPLDTVLPLICPTG